MKQMSSSSSHMDLNHDIPSTPGKFKMDKTSSYIQRCRHSSSVAKLTFFVFLGLIMPLPNLKIMELWNLKSLIVMPNVAGLVNLESFKLYSCLNLQEVHSSFGLLEKLVFLSIHDCPGIKKLPSINRLKKLKTLSFWVSPGLFQLSEIQQKKMDNLPYDPPHHLDNSGGDTQVNKPRKVLNIHVEECRLEEPTLPHNNIENHHTRQLLWFYRTDLTKLDLRWCKLRDEDIGSSEWELPLLQQLDLSQNDFSRIDFGHLRLPRLKWLCVERCEALVELSNLPSSIAVVDASECDSLERFGDTSNCKWLWKVSVCRGFGSGPFEGERLLNSMLQGNAIEDHFITLTLPHQVPKGGFVAGSFFRGKTFTSCHPHDSDKFTLRLPDDWYNDFSGFLIRVSNVYFRMVVEINMMQEEVADEEDLRFSSWQDAQSDVQPPPEPEYDGGVQTHVGFVSFSSFRRTTISLNPSFNIISFSMESETYVRSFAAELVPMKSKVDVVKTTTTKSSEYRDEEADGYFTNNTGFKIKHDSKSNIKIHWQTY